MTQVSVNSKSQLAKLLANENLTVEHKKTNTAYFMPDKRVLVCPIWKDMSNHTYDLLLGHEVGHALYTPAEGWHDAVSDNNIGRNFKAFLNVIEDARIEKRVQRKYPGLKRSFQIAYIELMKQDFFGIKDRDVNLLPFIDRLNLFTKSQYSLNIVFNDTEINYIDRIKELETWEQVVELAKEIYDYSKKEQSELYQTLNDFSNMSESDDDIEFDDSNDSVDGDDMETDQDSNNKNSTEYTNEEFDDETDYDYDDEGVINREKDTGISDQDQFSPNCITDNTFRNREFQLLDEKSREYVYADFPKPNLKNIVTPYKRVQELLSVFYKNYYDENSFAGSSVTELVGDFKRNNERYIGLLAKEFEMRKSAKSFSKSKLSDTGDIDVNKLSTYRFDDNIFRKVMITPKGKSHGLILLLDCSGSMSNNIAGSIEQILVMTTFCRKVGIPFKVFGFVNDSDVYYEDHNVNLWREGDTPFWEQKDNTVNLSTVQLREYLSSKMSNSEYSSALRNMILLKTSYEKACESRWNPWGQCRPKSESLSNTPLVESLVAMQPIMIEFKKQNNLELTNLLIVHDGDADNVRYYHEDEYTKSWDVYKQNVFLRDVKNKFVGKIKSELYTSSAQTTLYTTIDWFKKTTGSKVFGFFLVPTKSHYIRSAIFAHYYDKNGEKSDDVGVLTKKLRSEKILISNVPSYDSFFMITSDTLKTETDEIEISGKVTASKLKNAFMKYNKKRSLNRTFVTKFIEGIAS